MFNHNIILLVVEEGKVVDIENYVTKFDFRCHRVTMINNWFTVFSIPAVNYKNLRDKGKCINSRKQNDVLDTTGIMGYQDTKDICCQTAWKV